MKKIYSSVLAIAVATLSVVSLNPAHVSFAAAGTGLQEGVNITPVSSTDFGSASFDQSLQNLAATGANYVTLDIPLYQTNVNTTDVHAGSDTPTSQALASGIQYAHSLGLHVMLKFEDFSGDGQWSADINPSDRSSWFSNYLAAMTPIIKIAQANNVEEICLGTELIDMTTPSVNSTNTSNWLSLIAAVRNMYGGKLTYDANWGGSSLDDEKDNVQFWSALDYIGISAYFNLSGDGSVSSLMSSWSSIDSGQLQPLAQKWGKPILFTEIGYMSIDDSYTHPWMWWESGSPDETQQANDYQALFQYWSGVSYFAGFQLWNWSSNPNAGGSGDDGYSPQNKTAQTVMKSSFATVSQPQQPAPTFAASATVTPQSGSTGQPVSFSLTVSNSGGAVSGANVDVEIYNSAGSQVLQKIFSGQNFSANGSETYTFSWTPSATGSYTLKAGVFNGSWAQQYYWNNQVSVFSAGSGGSGGTSPAPSSTTTTGTETIDVWWPTNGSTITGVQPFKAMIPNTSVDSYSMFWQVDGGQLNPMPDNDTDYPHKEASVDVSPWYWRSGTGPYVVTFVAQNQQGATIANTSVNISN